MQRLLLVQFLLVLSIIGFSQKNINTAVLPSPSQLRWHQLEYYWFAHFGPNTFTGEEWGSGQEPTSLFNPINFDARQWCQLAKRPAPKVLSSQLSITMDSVYGPANTLHIQCVKVHGKMGKGIF